MIASSGVTRTSTARNKGIETDHLRRPLRARRQGPAHRPPATRALRQLRLYEVSCGIDRRDPAHRPPATRALRQSSAGDAEAEAPHPRTSTARNKGIETIEVTGPAQMLLAQLPPAHRPPATRALRPPPSPIFDRSGAAPAHRPPATRALRQRKEFIVFSSRRESRTSTARNKGIETDLPRPRARGNRHVPAHRPPATRALRRESDLPPGARTGHSSPHIDRPQQGH